MNDDFQEKAKPLNITFVGCGKMGGAMLEGCLNSFDDSVTFNVVKPTPLTGALAGHDQITYAASPDEIADKIAQSDLVLFTVKPQMMNDVCEEWKDYIAPETPVGHVCAGIQLKFLEEYLGDRPYARIMPNTPASVGKGVSGVYFNDAMTEDTQEVIEKLLSVTGEQVTLEHENQMDCVTAISGSGPAYVFYAVEHAMKTLDLPESEVRDFAINAGKSMDNGQPIEGSEDLVKFFELFQQRMLEGAQNLGLEKQTYENLVNQTIIGSAALIEGQADTPIAVLRANVTSKGGTTAAALNVMMEGDLLSEGKIETGMMAARDRGEELSDLALAAASKDQPTDRPSPK